MNYELTHPQKRIWYSEQKYIETSVYNLAGYLTYNDTLDVDRFIDAIYAVHKKWPILNGRVNNKIPPSLILECNDPEINTVHVYTNDELKKHCNKKSRESFNLSKKMYSYELLYKNENLIGLFFNFHHIIMDAMSVGLFVKAVESMYFKGIMYDMTDYESFIKAESDYKNSKAFQVSEKFWEAELKKYHIQSTITNRIDTNGYTTKRLTYSLGESLTHEIHSYLNSKRITLYRFIAAILYVYFYQITGNKHLTLMAGHHNRNKELMKMIGMTVSTVPLFATIDKEESFSSFLDSVSCHLRETFKNQSYPFDMIASKIRESGHDPHKLFQVGFNQIPEAQGLIGNLVRLSPGNDYMYLNIKINPNQKSVKENIEIGIDYRTSIYNEEEINLLYKRLKHMIKFVLENPQTPIKNIEYVGTDEMNHILNISGLSRKRSYFTDHTNEYKSVKSLLELGLNMNKSKIAVIDRHGSVTYGQLIDEVEGYKELLKDVQPGEIVTAALPRDHRIIGLFIALIEKRAIFMPMDGNISEEVKEYQIKHCHCQWLVYVQDGTFMVHKSSYDMPLDLYEREMRLGGCYIIFTSGTTGHSKGVVIPERAYASFCLWYMNYFDLDQSTRAMAYCSFGFDVSLSEYLPPIMTGGTVVMLDEEKRTNMRKLLGYIEETGVNLVTLPTRVGYMFMDQEVPKCVKKLIVAGEALHNFKLQHYEVYNAYGPTEATIYSTVKALKEDGLNPPIGTATSDMKLIVLDKKNHLVPIGESGELYLQGSQIAKGYHRPEFPGFYPMQKVTINDVTKRLTKVYRTGDTVKWVDDELVFLGRNDRQVKINGFRVELNGIEYRMKLMAGVREARAIVKNDRIVAFYSASKPVDIHYYKAHLGKTLPSYMVPSIIIYLPEMPKNKSGKIDDYDLFDKTVTTESKLPLNKDELLMIEIWKTVLQSNHIDEESHFFRMGGDSLKIMSMMLLIEEKFNKSIEFGAIYGKPVLKKFVEAVVDNQEGITYTINSNETCPKMVICFDYSGESYAYGHLIDHFSGNYEIIGTRYNSHFESCTSINEMARLIVEELEYDDKPIYFVGYSFGGILAIECHHIMKKQQRVSRLFAVDSPNFKDYSQLALSRFTMRNSLSWLMRVKREDQRIYLKKMIKSVWDNKLRFKKVFGRQFHMNKLLLCYEPEIMDTDLYILASSLRDNLDTHLGWEGYFEQIHMVTLKVAHTKLLKKENIPLIEQLIKLSDEHINEPV